MRYRVTHTTRFDYAEAVPLSHNLVRLRPQDHQRQRCLHHQLSVVPAPVIYSERIDYFGNHVAWFSLQEPHLRLTITASSEVQVDLLLRPEVSRGPSWEEVQQALKMASDPLTLQARQFIFDSPHVVRSSELAEYARPSFPPGQAFLQSVLDLTQRIQRDFKFLPGSTTVDTPVLDVLHNRRGVCQDFAHLEIGCLRSLGFAARYVSGYIATTPPPGQHRLTGADVSHAWIGVYTPDFGWIDFDPTNGLMPSDTHITVACARDYDEVGPVTGIVIGGQRQRLHVSVDVVPADA